MSAPGDVFRRLYKLENDMAQPPDVRETARLARSVLIDAEQAEYEVRSVFAEYWPHPEDERDAPVLADMVRELFAVKAVVHERLDDARREVRELRADLPTIKGESS